jgi:hypothetical protein
MRVSGLADGPMPGFAETPPGAGATAGIVNVWGPESPGLPGATGPVGRGCRAVGDGAGPTGFGLGADVAPRAVGAADGAFFGGAWRGCAGAGADPRIGPGGGTAAGTGVPTRAEGAAGAVGNGPFALGSDVRACGGVPD